MKCREGILKQYLATMFFFLYRCVPDNQRSYSLGFQFIFQRTLGFMPGPILLGWMFDVNCLFWGESCGRRGRCQIYDIWKLSVIITVFGCVMKGKMLKKGWKAKRKHVSALAARFGQHLACAFLQLRWLRSLESLRCSLLKLQISKFNRETK